MHASARSRAAEDYRSPKPLGDRLSVLECGSPLPLWIWIAILALSISATAAEVRCLPNAHAHNDYLHTRPLLDALDQGFCSVEADIHLVNGKLLVAHDEDKVDPAKTLESLYLDPIKERFGKNGKPGEFTLMIDVKTDAESTYAVLRETLKKYSAMLTVFRADAIEPKAVTVILSGNRAINTISNEPVRYAGIDGRLPDLESKTPRALVPWVSDNWTKTFTWRGEGKMPEDERARLKRLVQQAHEQGRKIRFWAIPDDRRGWAELHRAGVDLINTDNLAELRAFLISENL